MIIPTPEGYAFIAAQGAAYKACATDGCRNAEGLATKAALEVTGDRQAAADIGARAAMHARVEAAGGRL